MTTKHNRIVLAAIAAAVLGAMTACSGMSHQGQDTAIGAGAGAIGGAVLTGGSTVGVLGGAAIGGLVGHEVGKSGQK
jgi:osmotically inducible lipoprotein OsmB